MHYSDERFSGPPFAPCSSTNMHTLMLCTHLSHTHTFTVHIPFLLLSRKSIEWIRNKSLACIKKRLQGNIWSSQAAPCLANIQRILLPQKCEYVMYSQVTKQIQQGIHKSSWEAARHRQLPHASKIYNTPLIFASWFVCSVINKRNSIRCYYFVQLRGQWSHSPNALSVLFHLFFSCSITSYCCCIVIQCSLLQKWFNDVWYKQVFPFWSFYTIMDSCRLSLLARQQCCVSHWPFECIDWSQTASVVSKILCSCDCSGVK